MGKGDERGREEGVGVMGGGGTDGGGRRGDGVGWVWLQPTYGKTQAAQWDVGRERRGWWQLEARKNQAPICE